MRSKRYTALIAFMSFVKHLMLIEEHSTTIFFETKKNKHYVCTTARSSPCCHSKSLWRESSDFRSRKITAILKEQGYVTSEDTVRRLMADMSLTSIRQRAKALYEKERKAYCKNRVNQNFTAIAPNQIWVSDVTCYSFQERNYYICVILDLFSRMVVGYKIS